MIRLGAVLPRRLRFKADLGYGYYCIRRNPHREEYVPTQSSSSLLIILVGLIKEKVGGELFVLVACEIGLDHRVPREAQTAELVVFVSCT